MPPAHRKRCKRYDVPGDAHALTFSCFHRLPLLLQDRSRRWMLDGLVHGRALEMFDLWAYVIMPEHVHLLVWPHPGVSISSILKSVKQPVAQRALRWLKEHEPHYLSRLKGAERKPLLATGRRIRPQSADRLRRSRENRIRSQQPRASRVGRSCL